MATPADPVSRETLRELLDRWRSGLLTERAVHEEAEELLEKYGAEPAGFDRTDPRSIAFEVVSQLEVLNFQLITPADVPAFFEFLSAPSGAEIAAWKRWGGYWDGIDFTKRQKDLANNPYYAKHNLPSDAPDNH